MLLESSNRPATGDGQGEPVVAAGSGLEGGPGGERRHQGGHAHDEGAAAEKASLWLMAVTQNNRLAPAECRTGSPHS